MCSAPEDVQTTFTLALCSFAQDIGNGLLTLVNAGLDVHTSGQPLYLAGFVYGLAGEFVKEPLVVELPGGVDHPKELVNVPPPPEDALPDPAERVKITVVCDLASGVADLGPGKYDVVIRYAGAKHSLPLTVTSATAARAE